VAREIMPHEPRIRAWFLRRRVSPDEVDELMQDAYCRLVTLDGVEHIDCPHAYFFSVCRNLMVRRLKRQQIAPFEAISEIESYRDNGSPSPEEQVASRLAFDRVRMMLASLPERCRRIVELRKIEGWSQRKSPAIWASPKRRLKSRFRSACARSARDGACWSKSRNPSPPNRRRSAREPARTDHARGGAMGRPHGCRRLVGAG
jgi:RNA polymerase sigma factor (sigma-70 family)